MPFPTELRQLGGKMLGIRWSDGHDSIYQVRQIRLNCKCAVCVDEWTQKPTLDPTQVPEEIKPKKIESVGRYALQFHWSDGHDTGYYTFELLRSLCECPQCKKTKKAKAS